MKLNTKRIAGIAMVSAIAYAVMFFTKFEPLAAAPFLSFDAKDTILMIGAFIYGFPAAAAAPLAVALAEMFTRSTTGPVGMLMNFLSSFSYVCAASLIYRKNRTAGGAVAGMAAGSLIMTAAMLLWNYLITPLYMLVPREVVAGMLLPVFLPFNLIKAGLNTAFTLILYKPLITALRAADLLPAVSAPPEKPKYSVNAVLVITAVALILACVIAISLLNRAG